MPYAYVPDLYYTEQITRLPLGVEIHPPDRSPDCRACHKRLKARHCDFCLECLERMAEDRA